MSPAAQIGYLALRDMIAALTGLAEEALATGAGAPEPVRSSIRRLYTEGQAGTRAEAGAALVWAAGRAVERAGRRVVLALDDVDLIDGASMLALGDAVREGIGGVKVLMTSATLPGGAAGVMTREVRGLGPTEVAAWVEAAARADQDGRRMTVARTDAVEPLYLEHAWAYVEEEAPPPTSLEELIAQRIEALFPVERRVLQALAVAGECSVDELTRVLAEDDVEASLEVLVAGRFVDLTAERRALITHRVIAEQTIAAAPAGPIAALHGSASEVAGSDRSVELRAHHAARGNADFEAFLLVEEAARLRTLRGDDDGAVVMLSGGLEAAVTRGSRGDIMAQSAQAVFARKLGAALVAARRATEAIELLEVTMRARGLAATEEALILEQLAFAYAMSGKPEQSARRRRDAITSAERSGDAALAARLKTPQSPAEERPPAILYWAPFDAVARSRKSIAVMRAVTQSVRRDPRREED
jgi:hypothetical protein